MTRPERGWTLTAGTAAAAALGVLAAATLGTTATERALAVAPPTATNCPAPAPLNQASGAIAGNSWQTTTAAPIVSTINVTAPAGVKVRDVDVRTFIRAQASGDVRIDIEHGGKTVRLVSQKGPERGHNDLWYGATFDDQAENPVVTTTLPEIPGPTVSPEGKLAAFNGMDAAGVWTVTVRDTRTTQPADPPPPEIPPPFDPTNNPIDNGTFESWNMTIATAGTAAPTAQILQTSPAGAVQIADGPDGAVAEKTLVVNAAPGQRITNALVRTNITHAFSSDLRVELVPPSGPVITLSPGGGIVGNFATQVDWSDTAVNTVTTPVDNRSLLQPLNALSRLQGLEAGGTWTLRVKDRFAGDAPGNSGTPAFINSFRLDLQTSRGCSTDVEATGPASASATTGQTATVNYTVTNTAPGGAAADGSTFSLSPAAGLDIISVNGAPYTGPVNAGAFDNAGAGAQKTFAVVVRANAAGSYTLTGTAGIAPQLDSNTANNAAVTSVTFTDPGVTPAPAPAPTPTPTPVAPAPTPVVPVTGTPAIGLRLGGLNTKRITVRRGALVRRTFTLNSAAQVTVQLRKGNTVVKRAVIRGKKGRNVVTFRLVRATGAYRLVIVAKPTRGKAVTRVIPVTIRR